MIEPKQKPPRGRGGARPGAGRKPDAYKQMFDTAVRSVVTQEQMNALVKATLDAAIGGDTKAAALLLDRMLGKVPQAVQMSGGEGEPLNIIVTYEDSPAR